MLIKIKDSEIKIGEALPWSVYDAEGRLLLSEGNVVPSERILAAVVEHGVFRILNEDDTEEMDANAKNKKDPFELLCECANYTEKLFAAIEDSEDTVEYRVKQLVKGFRQLFTNYTDACIGAIHVCHSGQYTLWHPLCVAMLCELVASRLGLPEEQHFALLAAAFTSNIGMRELQEELFHQDAPLTEQQRKSLNVHPAKSAEMLIESGITNVDWVKAVFQHHERMDGSGYPEGIKSSEIGQLARLLAVADRYAAMVRGRAYRKAIHGKDTLRELLVENGQFYDQELSLVLISELGVYPPGTIVQLKNREVGMVVNRGKKNATIPLVTVFIGPNGAVLDKPILRNCVVSSYKIHDKFEIHGELPFDLLELWNATYATNQQLNDSSQLG